MTLIYYSGECLSGSHISAISGDIAEDLLGRCVSRGKESRAKAMAFRGEVVAVGLGDFSNEAVSAMQANLATAPTGDLATMFGREVATDGMEETLDVTVSETCGGEFTSGDGLEQGDISGVANARGSDATAEEGDGAGHLVEDYGQGGRVVDREQGDRPSH